MTAISGGSESLQNEVFSLPKDLTEDEWQAAVMALVDKYNRLVYFAQERKEGTMKN